MGVEEVDGRKASAVSLSVEVDDAGAEPARVLQGRHVRRGPDGALHRGGGRVAGTGADLPGAAPAEHDRVLDGSDLEPLEAREHRRDQGLTGSARPRQARAGPPECGR